MNHPSREFDDAVSAICHGMATDPQVRELAALLQTDPAARDAYLAAVELHARLAAEDGLFLKRTEAKPEEPLGETMRRAEVASVASRRLQRLQFAMAAAAIVLSAICAWQWLGRKTGTMAETEPVAIRILETDGNVQPEWRAGQTVAVKQLELATGTMRFQIERSGVVLGVSGPARIRLVHPMLASLLRGQLTADVGERGKGFSVQTDQCRFVDLGTAFGIDANAEGTTDLVVFKGSVRVFSDARQAALLSTLAEGEAVRVGGDKSLARIPNIVSGASLGPWSTRPPHPDQCVIASVRDNLRSPHDRVFYQIIPGGFQENTPAYVGPSHVWKGRTAQGLPPYLLGADFVRTFPTDQGRKGLDITVKLSRPAILYVLFETRHQQQAWRQASNPPEAPAWLVEKFHKIGDAVGLDDAGQLRPGEAMSLKPGEGHLVTFDVWKREIKEPGEVTLGPPTGPEGWKNWMYGIAAKPLKPSASDTTK